MVDALVSGASAERRVGSSPILGTSKELSFRKFFFLFDHVKWSNILPSDKQTLIPGGIL